MFANMFRRFRRAPLTALAVVLLAAVLSAALCGLEAANTAQQLKYEEMRRTVPVTLRVTNLSATRRDNLDCPRWVYNALTGKGLKEERSLAQYVKDACFKMTQSVTNAVIDGTEVNVSLLAGINIPVADDSLAQKEKSIKWFAGYDASMLEGSDFLCLLPANLVPEGFDGSSPLQISITVENQPMDSVVTQEYIFTVVGTHGAGSTVYCPLITMQRVYTSVGRDAAFGSVSATLADNELLEEFRERSKLWFAEPNATGEHTPWDYSYYFWYPYALEIDTSLLDRAELTLKAGLLLNQLCSYLVFILSAGAGFFIGFLMIRQRKREIALMRSMGTPPASIFFTYALEQVVCVVVGAVIGGAPFLWQPIERLGWFLVLYAVGLTIALLIFLRKNLLTAIKEDE